MRQHVRHGARSVVAGGLAGLLMLGLAACRSTATPDDDAALGVRGAPTAPAPAPTPSPGAVDPDPATITLAFAGDVHFEGGLMGVPAQAGSTLGPMSRSLRSADLAVVNLETAITRRDTPASKELEVPGNRYWFRSPPAALDVLDRSGVDVVSVANNHGADHGVGGLRDTLRAAARSPVAVVGVGRDERQAFRPHRVTIRGTDVAVLAADASRRESTEATWAAEPGTGPGLAAARGDAGRLLAAVRAAAAVDDLVVVYLHWGEEGAGCPTREQPALARALALAGADVVVGSHTHRLLGAGTQGTGPDEAYVSYGLGNFFWYHGRTAETGVLRLTVTGDDVVGDEWVPAMIPPEGAAPRPLGGTARADAVADWERLRRCTDLAPGPGVAPADASGTLPRFSATVSRIGPALRQRMTSHDPASCPVALADLRHLTLTYVGFDGAAHRGEMVVAAGVAADVVGVFGSLYRDRFPIRRMRLVDAYGGDDDRSMAADNTSGYNCRRVAGTTTFSDHAYGRAVDVNPVENPYVLGRRVLPPAGRRFVDVDRTPGARARPGVTSRTTS